VQLNSIVFKAVTRPCPHHIQADLQALQLEGQRQAACRGGQHVLRGAKHTTHRRGVLAERRHADEASELWTLSNTAIKHGAPVEQSTGQHRRAPRCWPPRDPRRIAPWGARPCAPAPTCPRRRGRLTRRPAAQRGGHTRRDAEKSSQLGSWEAFRWARVSARGLKRLRGPAALTSPLGKRLLPYSTFPSKGRDAIVPS
jgi:hypothetical protein